MLRIFYQVFGVLAGFDVRVLLGDCWFFQMVV